MYIILKMQLNYESVDFGGGWFANNGADYKIKEMLGEMANINL